MDAIGKREKEKPMPNPVRIMYKVNKVLLVSGVMVPNRSIPAK
jgi:hypothetical protein